MVISNWRLSAAATCLAGLVYGFGLARFLFEQFPTRLTFLGDWPGALFCAAAVAVFVLGVWLALRRRFQAGAAAAAFCPLLYPLLSIFDPRVDLLRAGTLLVGGVVGGALLVIRDLSGLWTGLRRASRWLAPLAVSAILAALYLRTLAPTVGEADTFEFQVDILRLAVAHPSGYPLYILIGKLFSLLPIPASAAYRINLSSAFFGIVASLGVYALVLRLGGDRLVSAMSALIFGLSFGLWSRAVEAEVYSLNAAFVAAILWTLALSRPEGAPTIGQLSASPPNLIERLPSSFYLLPFLAFLFGLSLSNHLTTLLLAPAVIAALAFARLRSNYHLPITPKTLVLSAALFLLGLSVYLYIPLRWPAVNNGEVMSLAQFFGYITGQQAQGALRLNAWHADPSRYGIVGGKALAAFGWVGAALAVAGVVWLAIREWRLVIMLGLAWAGYEVFGLSFYVPDPDFSAFLIPAHLIQTVFIGLGATAVVRIAYLVARSQSAICNLPSAICNLPSAICNLPSAICNLPSAICNLPSAIRHLPSAVFLLLPLSFIWNHLPRVDQSDDWSKYELGKYILSYPLAENAVVLADSEKIAPLYYLQVAEGVRPDLRIAVLPDETAYRAALDEAVAAGRTVYLGRYLPGLQSFFHLRSVGPLTEVGVVPLTEIPPVSRSLDLTFGDSIRLVGVDFDATEIHAGSPLRFTLYWQAERPVDANYLVRLRLSDAEDHVVWENLGRVPANNFYPTNAWRVGEIVPDFHEIALDTSLVPGEYTLSVGLFPPFGEEGLTLADGGEWARVGKVVVMPPFGVPQIPNPIRWKYSPGDLSGLQDLTGLGPTWLLGYSAPESVSLGSRVEVALFWRVAPGAVAPGRRSYVLSDSFGRELFTSSFDPNAWPPGAVIKTIAEFRAPAQPQSLTLNLSLDGHSARCGWLQPITDHCSLITVNTEGEAVSPGSVVFADKILLRSLTIGTPEALPGAIVRVSADWRALASMDADYTVFVHLLGPDGMVHGQVDTWPGQGTRPTSGWKPGETIRDTYEIRVPDDAPPGEYSVEVGWYLLATLERLPVLGEGGAPVDDRVLREGLVVEK